MASNITGFGVIIISTVLPLSLFPSLPDKIRAGNSWLIFYTVLVAREPTKMITFTSTFAPTKVLERTFMDLA